MKIAVYGGTFNPIHYGHLRAAEEAREYLGLDKVVFIPAYMPPHKEDTEITAPDLRLEIVRLAVEGNPGFEVSDMEIKRGGRSFTVDTLRQLGEELGPSVELSLIVGNDSFNDIRTWCEYEEIFRLANVIVVPRPGYPPKKLAEALPVELARKFWYDSEVELYRNSFGNTVVYLNTTLFGVSSSEIRSMAARSISLRYLMPEAVSDYIIRAGLYK